MDVYQFLNTFYSAKMNIFFTISKIFIFCLLSEVSGISLLEKLLKSQIREAQCQARCQSQENQEDVRMCLEVCRIVVRNPGSPICQLPNLCSGACQAACQDDAIKNERIVSVNQEVCQLSWSLETGINDDLIFIISGVDLGGKINLVTSGVKETSFEMTKPMTEKYLEMTVIAVGSQGVLDIQSSIIEPQNKCGSAKESNNIDQYKANAADVDDEVKIKKITNKNLLQTLICAFLAAIFFVVFGIICCKPRKQKFSKLENASEMV